MMLNSDFIIKSRQTHEGPRARAVDKDLQEIFRSTAHPVLRAPLVQSAASAGCGSCFPAGFAGLPLRRVQTTRGRCCHRCPVLREWEGCSGTR